MGLIWQCGLTFASVMGGVLIVSLWAKLQSKEVWRAKNVIVAVWIVRTKIFRQKSKTIFKRWWPLLLLTFSHFFQKCWMRKETCAIFQRPLYTPIPLGRPDYAVRHKQQKNMLAVGMFMGERGLNRSLHLLNEHKNLLGYSRGLSSPSLW